MLRDMVKYALNEGDTRCYRSDRRCRRPESQGDGIRPIVTDINMPNMNGFDLDRELRKLPSYAKPRFSPLTTERT